MEYKREIAIRWLGLILFAATVLSFIGIYFLEPSHLRWAIFLYYIVILLFCLPAMDKDSIRNKFVLSLLPMVAVGVSLDIVFDWGLSRKPVLFVLFFISPFLIKRDIHNSRELTIRNMFISVASFAFHYVRAIATMFAMLLILSIIIWFIDIHHAEKEGAEGVASILESETDPNQRTEYGETFLHVVLKHEHDDAKGKVSLLLDKGADVNAKDGGGTTPLHHAARTVNEDAKETVSLLLDKGADANARDNGGGTPLHYAVRFADDDAKETVSLLLDKGADANARDNGGGTPLHYAVRFADDDAKEIVSLLLGKGADANAKDGRGGTPLHYAARFMDDDAKETVSLLLGKGADANAKNDRGDTPLHVAAVNGSAEFAAFLIGRGADIHIENRSGGSFLSELKKRIQEDPNFRNSKGYKELIKSLPGFGDTGAASIGIIEKGGYFTSGSNKFIDKRNSKGKKRAFYNEYLF